MENLKKQAILLTFLITGVVFGGLIGALTMGLLGFLAQKFYDTSKIQKEIKLIIVVGIFFIGVVLWFLFASIFLSVFYSILGISA